MGSPSDMGSASAERPVALVTGSSRGIGRAAAVLLASRGMRVVLNGRDAAALAETAATIRAAGGEEPLQLAYDVADAAAVKAAFGRIVAECRRLDVLVNNAGILEAVPVSMLTPDHVRRLLDVNVQSVLLHMHFGARLMARRKKGAIVNLTSIMGVRGAAGYVAYSASKAAVVGATLAAAKELAPLGIRVNAVAPGFVDTDMTRALRPEELAATLATIPAGRAALPSEVAETIAFLASDAAAYVTGQVLGVDGGFRV